MYRLNTRAKIFGVVTILLALASAVYAGLLAFAVMGIGTAIAISAKGSVLFGAAVGLKGLKGASILLAVALFKGFVGLTILQRQKLGLFFGLVLATLGLIAGISGTWVTLVWGVFGLWALWTSRAQFR